jgi:hypothetical protein
MYVLTLQKFTNAKLEFMASYVNIDFLALKATNWKI